jgi:hypothetical protein
VTAIDPQLRDYLETVRKLLADQVGPVYALDSADTVSALTDTLAKADVLSLATETATMSASLVWLAATVTEIAMITPSVAIAVAAHYTADRAAAGMDGCEAPRIGSAGVVLPPKPSLSGSGLQLAVIPTVLQPDAVLLLDLATARSAVVPFAADHDGSDERAFSGLRGARLRDLSVRADQPGELTLSGHAAMQASCDWVVLCSAVLVGIARGAARSAETYAADRRQFGSALTSFAAVRVLLADMHRRVEGVDALLGRAVQPEATELECWLVAAEAGRAAVNVALDAIQVHGGYGYVEEYPVAGRLRDALSVQARCGGRRVALRHVAHRRLGAPAWEASE